MNQTIERVAIKDLTEHPIHKNCFLEADKKIKTADYHASISKYGKIKQVVYVEANNQKMVIDGWSYVQYAELHGIEDVPAKLVEVSTDEDLLQIMLELQFSDHNTPQEEYRIYKEAYKILSKGRGHRTDLEAEISQTDTAKRRPTVYDKIAAMTGASSGKRVQQLIKVGDINPHYLEHMEEEKASLNTAYLNCKSEERGDLPQAPAVKSPVYLASVTPVPEFNETAMMNSTSNIDSSLNDSIDEEQYAGINVEANANGQLQPGDLNGGAESVDVSVNVAKYVTLPGICGCCGRSGIMKIEFNELLKVREWNTKN